MKLYLVFTVCREWILKCKGDSKGFSALTVTLHPVYLHVGKSTILTQMAHLDIKNKQQDSSIVLFVRLTHEHFPSHGIITHIPIYGK